MPKDSGHQRKSPGLEREFLIDDLTPVARDLLNTTQATRVKIYVRMEDCETSIELTRES